MLRSCELLVVSRAESLEPERSSRGGAIMGLATSDDRG
jgi:hypothetical protein